MRQESQFDRALISRAGARGVMQLMPGTGREQAGKLGVAWDSGMLLSSTDYNIQLGTAYFQRLYAIYASYPLAIAAYNAGGGNVNKWLAANGDPRTGSGRLDRLDRGDPVRRDQALRPARARECGGLRPDQPATRDLDRQCAAELVSRQQAAGLSHHRPAQLHHARRFRDACAPNISNCCPTNARSWSR